MTIGCSRIARSFEFPHLISSVTRCQKRHGSFSGNAGRCLSLASNSVKPRDVRVVVGIEVHCRVLSQTKLFSNGSADYERGVGKPNSQVSLFDAAIPGTLPTLNEECINQAIRCGLALGGTINHESIFERKHYFYSDMPLGYQITQQRSPIVTGGTVSFANPAGRVDNMDDKKLVRITRVQLEIDSGKSLHSTSGDVTYVDLNRAGMALLEIVSEPDMRSAEDAVAYLSAVRALVRAIGVSDGNMEDVSIYVSMYLCIYVSMYLCIYVSMYLSIYLRFRFATLRITMSRNGRSH
jgi:aspartyl/glutamyl-tRNA(Asn/Gln) amidotransferase B subunit